MGNEGLNENWTHLQRDIEDNNSERESSGGQKAWMLSKVGPRFQAIFQRKAWTLEGEKENQIVIWGKGVVEREDK